VRLLLDTHVFLWVVLGSPKLKPSARSLVEDSSAVFVSSASIWEVAIKAAMGKIDVEPSLLIDEIEQGGFIELPVTARHAAGVGSLPQLHGDPFDRILIAQALAEHLALLTSDRQLARYGPAVRCL
jgi:PIN domain nuclease of toxin-antitoxin system